jgi:hypothetical protein
VFVEQLLHPSAHPQPDADDLVLPLLHPDLPTSTLGPPRSLLCITSIVCRSLLYTALPSILMAGEDLALRFGELVRRLRSEKGLSQERLAELCGMYHNYVGRSRGRRGPHRSWPPTAWPERWAPPFRACSRSWSGARMIQLPDKRRVHHDYQSRTY